MVNKPVESSDESIEDILSSIRATVEDEADKDDDAAVHLAESAAEEAEPVATPDEESLDADDDVLELADMEEIDVETADEADFGTDDDGFAATEDAAVKAAGMGAESTVDVDAVLNEMNMAEDTEAIAASAEMTEDDILAAFRAGGEVSTRDNKEYVHLNATPGAQGLQVGFPMEILAEALRPLVRGWIQQNLPEIVERLVREELEKLAEKE